VLGDSGVNLSLEFHTPKRLPDDWDAVQNFRLLAFVDWANVWIYQPIAPTRGLARLTSAGMGLSVLSAGERQYGSAAGGFQNGL
jgi:hypothetical protein